MISVNENIIEMINAPLREIKGRVELYNSSLIPLQTFSYDDALQGFTAEKTGENGKFFGFGISQKLTLKLVDKERQIEIDKGQILDAGLGVNDDYTYSFPHFFVEEVKRNENDNSLEVAAYDKLNVAAAHTVSEITLGAYTLEELTTACAGVLGLSLRIENVDDDVFNTDYATGANFEGTETIREVLDDIAEATQTIYYINNRNELTFKRLSKGEPVLIVDKDKYFTLDSKTEATIGGICSYTELGDNLEAGVEPFQSVRDNAFWDLRDDRSILLDNALAAVSGLTAAQIELKWRGNFTLEVGDKIGITTKDDGIITTYVINDSIIYDGGVIEKTSWSQADNKKETTSNPTNLGEAVKQTFAKVDKANKQINLMVSETEANSSSISELQMNTEGIAASVVNIQTNMSEVTEDMKADISTLTEKVNTQVTPQDIQIEIQKELANGTDKVTTKTGFTLDENGLNVSKTDSEMSTQISENGMTVAKNGDTMLTANNVGVNAVNLHATTFLIIGTNSRFENYKGDRTGCFFVGNIGGR